MITGGTSLPDVREQYLAIKLGYIPGLSIQHVYGATTLTTSMSAITASGFYRTPTSATALEIVSSSTDDASAGTGAQEVTIEGLDSNWAQVTIPVETNGTTAVAVPTNLIRVTRWHVSRSGTYATVTGGSHVGTLTLRESGAGQTWFVISATPIPLGESQIGVYTVPIGYTAYLLGKHLFVESNKQADLYFFARQNANDTSAPYTGILRVFEKEISVTNAFDVTTRAPKRPLVGPCDIGFVGKVSASTADASVEFELLLVQDGYGF